jgi:hypothetical protein
MKAEILEKKELQEIKIFAENFSELKEIAKKIQYDKRAEFLNEDKDFAYFIIRKDFKLKNFNFCKDSIIHLKKR